METSKASVNTSQLLRKTLPFCFLAALALLGGAETAKAESILIIGDSLSCGPFGGEMLKGLAAQGHKVRLYCSVSSSPRNWVSGTNAKSKTGVFPCETREIQPHASDYTKGSCDGSPKIPKFADILRTNPSSRVIVALGTNSLPDGPDANYSAMTSQIKGAGRTCDWIGPPHLEPRANCLVRPADGLCVREAGLTKMYTSLRSKVGGDCRVISSLDATKPGTAGNKTGDGIHSTAAAATFRFQTMRSEILSGPAGGSSRPTKASGRSN